MKEIKITDISGFKIGNAQDKDGGSGCTVILCPCGATAGVDVRGGGPATRETDLLKPENMVQQIHGVMLSGGSAFGLEAACGAMDFLEEKNIGFDVGVGVVPIVCGASLFDLVVGDSKCRPDKQMGYDACENAYCDSSEFVSGNSGAGTGATVGKLMGTERMMKSGLGDYAFQTGDLKVGAVTALNALGDIFDSDTGRQLAGLLTEDGSTFANTESSLLEREAGGANVFKGNTTISCVITNAKLTKANCTKIASIAHDGYARAIRPVHTSADGDTIFVMSTCEVDADFDAVGAGAAFAVARAIKSACVNAQSAYGLKCSKDIVKDL